MSAEPYVRAEDLGDYLDTMPQQAGDKPSDSWTPLTFQDAPDEPPIKPVLGSTSLLYPGKRHVFSGPPESAKTLAAYAILILIARSGQTGILVDFEMGVADAKTRLRELGATHEELGRLLYIGPDEKATVERVGLLISLAPALIVIDAAAGAYQLEGLDENKRSDVEQFASLYIAPFWRAGIASLTIDHVVKNSETRGRFQIGSERKLGATDVHLGFDVIRPISRGTSGQYKITTHKDRVGALRRGHLADLHLDSDPDTSQITWRFTEPPDDAQAGYFRPDYLMEKVSVDLELRNEHVTRNDVVRVVKGSKEHVLKAITALVHEGFVAETDGPNRSKLLKTTRRYRRDDPSCNPENLSSGSVVLCGSQVVPDHAWLGGSGGSPPSRGEPPDHRHHDHPEQLGWFAENGHLDETTDAYLESIAPDPEIDDDPEPVPARNPTSHRTPTVHDA